MGDHGATEPPHPDDGRFREWGHRNRSYMKKKTFVRFRPIPRAFVSAAIVSCSLTCGWAQQSPSGQAPIPDAPSATQSHARSAPQGALEPFLSVLTRRSIFFPDIAATPGPLSTGEKFKLFLDDSISPAQLTQSAFGAGIAQAEDSPSGYGQGGEGYAKRFGSSMARGASEEFFGTFMLASILHQDPRFFPELNPSFGHAAKYSLKRLFVTRNDQGQNVANWSGLLGAAMSEGLANAYWPEQDRTAGQSVRRFGLDLATRAGGNMLRDYWPVFFKKLRIPGVTQPGSR